MAKSAKAIMKDAATAAAEKALTAFMPELNQRLAHIEQQLMKADRNEHGLREYLSTKFDLMQETINELGQRIARMEGKVENFMEILHSQSGRMDDWLERLVRVEMGAPQRPKKKAS